MKIVVANTSAPPHVKQTVLSYREAGFLGHFMTAFFDHPENRTASLFKRLGVSPQELARRAFHELEIEKFKARPVPELLRSIAARKMPAGFTDRVWEWSELGFDRWVARKARRMPVDAVHTYEHSALYTLQMAKQRNLFSIYEQPSQHHAFFSEMAAEQLRLYPELKSAATELLVNEKAAKRNCRRDEELKLAELVICNSSFTKKTLVNGGTDPSKIIVIPLAFPEVGASAKPDIAGRPLRFIYAGNQSLRKASHILYQAWRDCNFRDNEAELWLVGKMLLPDQLRQGLPGKVVIRNNMPQNELMSLFDNTDVLILPSLADGFGMVITEAMSRGVAVIASENTGGPDIIDPMRDGWIVPAGATGALADRMRWCVENPGSVAQAGQAAREKARSWQWPHFRRQLSDTVFQKWNEFRERTGCA